MIETNIKLPEKASDLIELALRDLRKVEQARSQYIVDMGLWHSQEADEDNFPAKPRCSVCFAGAVMAGTLGADPADYLVPSDYKDLWNRSRLQALDSFRCGFVEDGLSYMNATLWGEHEAGVPIPAYSNIDPEPFHAAMAALAVSLRAAGY